MSKQPFSIEGYLNLESQEGGYAGPDWTIDGRSLADILCGYFQAHKMTYAEWKDKLNPKSPTPGDVPIGRVRIAIELLEPVQ